MTGKRSAFIVALAALAFLISSPPQVRAQTEYVDYLPPVNALGEWKKNPEAAVHDKKWHVCEAEPSATDAAVPAFCADDPEQVKNIPSAVSKLRLALEGARTRGKFKSKDLDKLVFASPRSPGFGANPDFEVFNKDGTFKVDWDAYIQDVTKIAMHDSQIVFPIYRYLGPQPGEIHDYLFEVITNIKPTYCRWHSDRNLELRRAPDLEKGPMVQEGELPFYLLTPNCLHDPQGVWYRFVVIASRSNRMPTTDIERIRAAAMSGSLDAQMVLVSSMAPWAKDDPEQFYFWSSLVFRRGGRVMSGNPNEFAKAALPPEVKEAEDQRITNMFRAHPELQADPDQPPPANPAPAPEAPPVLGTP